MAIDINALRSKFNELKGATARNDVLWKPTKGDNTIRIVPLKDNPEIPFTELYFHYLGNKTTLSPISFGEPDPIAEFAEAIRADAPGGKMPKDDYREMKKFMPQRRTFVPVIDRSKPEDGVRFWAFGKTVYNDLLAIMTDVAEYGDITDPQVGRDIKVRFTPAEESDTGFAKTSIQVSVKQTPLTKDATELKKFLNEQPDLMSLYPRKSYDELKDFLATYVNGGSVAQASTRTVVSKTDDDWASPEDVESPTAAKARSNTKTKTASDAEDEFAKLFETK